MLFFVMHTTNWLKLVSASSHPIIAADEMQ